MVAKIVVLARALGVHFSASAVQLEPLIPKSELDTIAWSNDLKMDNIVTGLEAYDATFRKKYYIPAVAESKRPHYVKLIDLTKFLSM
ncbi:hypothetical protein DD238_004774 [Peronospora effusa]|uniref:Uncharacterized protein n=2 Tax=Peronospora effusa TaxID=542832 RepID=A0A3M6VF38_9STRA|nr:hypothetical protein DD238_004774 [Peronospora effusa]